MTSLIEYALLAANVYGVSNEVRAARNTLPIPDGWTPTGAGASISSAGQVLSDGFMARAYQSGNDIVISYAGTTDENGLDWLTGNVPAATASFLAPQIVDAAKFYLDVLKANPNANITFTGHSLGGGLASLMAVYFNRPATVFDEAPFQKSADSSNIVSALKLVLVNSGYALPVDFQNYVAAPDPSGAIVPSPSRVARQYQVHQTFVAGEVLSLAGAAVTNFVALALGVVSPSLWFVGTGIDKINDGSASILDPKAQSILNWGYSATNGNPTDLHSITLLSGFLLSPGFFAATKAHPELLPSLFKGNYINNPKNQNISNLTDLLVQRQYRGEGALDALAVDVNKIDRANGLTAVQYLPAPVGATTLDVNVASILVDASLAGLYEQGKTRTPDQGFVGQFSTVLRSGTGSLTVDLQALGKQADPVKSELTALAILLARDLNTKAADFAAATRWTLQDGANALQAGFTSDNINDVVLGYDQADSILAGGGDDVLITGGGDDTLDGGAGNDKLYGGTGADNLSGGIGNDVLYGGAGDDQLDGGAGYDRYRIEGNDTVIDSDRAGFIEDRNGQRIVGQINKGPDGKYTFLSNPAITVAANGADIKLTLPSGDTVTLKDFGKGMLGLTLSTEPPAPTNFSRVIVGDLAPVDSDPDTPGMQPVLDDLGNIASTVAEPDRMDGLLDSAGDDDIYGLGGNDWIRAYAGGNDRLDGGAGDDVITEARAGNDTLIGGDGRDVLFGDMGDDRLYAGAVVSIDAALAAGNEPATGLQGELLDGGEGDDTLVASAGDDAINGGRGADLIVAGAGDDNIRGDAEADREWAGKAWSVTRTVTPNADGSDSYSAVYHNVSFTPTTAGGWTAEYTADSVTYTGIGEQVTTGDDVIYAGAGCDWVWGEWGQDYIDGGDGDDVLFGQEGSDLIVGGAGNDVIAGDGGDLAYQGDDYLDGGDGNDTLWGGGGSDQLFGGAGDDSLTGDDAAQYAGDDYLDGGDGADTLLGMGGNDQLLGGDGNDTLVGGDGADQMFGGSGADLMLGDNGDGGASGGADTMDGGAGDDDMVGEAGDDLMDGGEGNDLMVGGAGSDQLLGGAGDDQLQGGDGNDVLDAGDGNNSLFGQDGDDALQAGSGDDYLDGGLGNDTLAGGDGNDTYHYKRGDGVDHITDTGGTDTLVLEGITWQEMTLGTGSLKLSFAGGEIHLDDFDPDDPFAPGGIERFQFADGTVMSRSQLITALGMKPTGTPGPDVLTGTSLNDTMSGLAGDDTLTGRAGIDQLDGGDGNDLLMGGDGEDGLYGGAGNDTLLGEAGNDGLRGGDGDDVLDGGTGTNGYDGGAGNDTYLFGRLSALDMINEPMVPTFGSDTIRLDSDVTPADVWVYRSHDRLVLMLPVGGPQVISTIDGPTLAIFNWFASETSDAVNPTGAVRQVVFADGTVWGVAELTALSRRVTERDDYVVLSAGDDVLDALDGADTVYGGDGADKLYGGAGADHLYGQSGNDTLYGGADEDELYGGDGADSLDGGAGDDLLLSGGAGDDTLNGGLGNDRLDGGVGNDTYLFGRGDGVDVVSDKDFLPGNIDTVQLAAGLTPADVSFTRDARSLYISINGSADRMKLTDWYVGNAYQVERVLFADGTALQGDALQAKIIAVFDEGDNYGAGTAGADILDGLGGNDEIHGLDGDDLLIGGTGNDQLWGEAGNDTLDGGAGNDYLDGGIGNDTYTFGFGAGQNFVNDYDTTPGNVDTIRMAVGVSPSDVTVSRVKNILQLSLNGGADLLKVIDWFALDADKVERVVFADGTVWGVAELQALVNAPANRAPLTSTDSADLTEDGLPADTGVPYVSGSVTANDADPEGRVLAVTTLGKLPGAFGALYMNADGSYVYRLEANASTAVQSLGIGDSLTDRFVYTVTDNDPRGAATATGELVVTIHGSNDAPVLKIPLASQSATEDSAWTFTVPASTFADVDLRDSLTYSAKLGGGAALPSWLTFDATTRTFSGTPRNADVGNLSVQVVATDTSNASAASTFTLSVANVNDAPTAVGTLADWTTSAGSAASYTFALSAFNDIDVGDTLTYSATLAGGAALPSWLTFNASTRTFSGTPTASDGGDFSLKVIATDSGGLTAFQDVALHVDAGLVLRGTPAKDSLIGGAGDDTIDGLADADQMRGGKGNDTYFVDNSGDTVVELPNEGFDIVHSSISYTLPANVEELVLDAPASPHPPFPLPPNAIGPGIDGTGNALDNILIGNRQANTLTGGAGNDILDGREGSDQLVGGTGNDTYLLARNYGHDTIAEDDGTIGNFDVASFGPGITADQLWFAKKGEDLQVFVIGTDDMFSVTGWYKGTSHHVEEFKTSDGKVLLDSQVQNLVQAMAAFAPPAAGQTTLTAAYQNALGGLIAANWH